MKIKINNQEAEFSKGETILEICRRQEIRIPTLCAMKNHCEGVCRVCLVEQNGRLITSCNTKATDGMEIITESEKIARARKINLELLWADHAGKCVTCKKNQRCELQNLAMEQKIENFHFVPRKDELTSREELDLLKDNRMRVVVDESNPCVARTTELCVECRHCINVCPTQELAFNHRAGDVVVGTSYEKPLDCIFCGQCVKHCPTGAITDKNNLAEIVEKLDDTNKLAIAIWDPTLEHAMSLEQSEIDSQRKMIGVLRQVGFEVVVDLGFGMELYLKKAEQEIKKRKQKNILLSHCPSFNLYLEKYHPELKANLLEVLTPDELLAQYIKNEYAQKHKINPKNIIVVSISPCVAKKAKKNAALDYVLTIREVGRIMRQKKINLVDLAGSEFDHDLIVKNKKIKKTLQAGGMAESLAANMKMDYIAVNEVRNIEKMLHNLKAGRIQTEIIEAMICPGGCVGGGGQSKQIL